MLTPKQLSDWLLTQNVEALAIYTGLSSKTIYRLRWCDTRPSYRTMSLLIKAGAKAPPKPRKAKA